jgi:hypothetical protein
MAKMKNLEVRRVCVTFVSNTNNIMITDVSRTLWAPSVLGKVAPVPAIFML